MVLPIVVTGSTDVALDSATAKYVSVKKVYCA